MNYRLFSMLAILSVCSGCLNSYGRDAVSVSGILTWKGRPVPGVTVNLIPATPERRVCHAVTRDDGTFDMIFSSSVRGAVPGDYQVEFAWSPVDEKQVREGIVDELLKYVSKRDAITCTIRRERSNHLELSLPE